MPIPFRNFRKSKPRFMARKHKFPLCIISHFKHHNPAYLLHKNRKNNRKTHKTKHESKINRQAPPVLKPPLPIPHTKTKQTNTTFNISEHENSISQPYMTVFQTKIPPFRTPIYRFPIPVHHFPTMISRISQSIPPFSSPFYSKSASYIDISHLPKPPNRHSNRRKQCQKSPYPRSKAMKTTLKTAKYVAEMAKWWCGDGGWDLRFRLKFIVLRRLRGAFRAFPILISRISQSIPPFSPPFYSKSTPYINISHLPKPPNPHSNRRKQC